MARAIGSYPIGPRFKSVRRHQNLVICKVFLFYGRIFSLQREYLSRTLETLSFMGTNLLFATISDTGGKENGKEKV